METNVESNEYATSNSKDVVNDTGAVIKDVVKIGAIVTMFIVMLKAFNKRKVLEKKGTVREAK